MQAPHTQSPTPALTFAQRFSATRRGARLARLLAAHRLTEWGHPYGTETHDTVVLVVAELAANSVLHGRVPGRDFALSLSCDAGRGVIRIEVTDTHPALPVRRAPGADETPLANPQRRPIGFSVPEKRPESGVSLGLPSHSAIPRRCVRPQPPDEDGGRGLVLVDALAADWGVLDRPGPGKTVWAECATGVRG
ncbi:ATP-binding protein [Streptomyces sp. NPDC046862]|uniref:ATP-binding protein n=1 Tax=Streptomyces sp. NPDC046862 TaxID=3154603 RepID=UPI0034534D72